MNRRDTVLALRALGSVPLATRAQPAAKPARIAWLGFNNPEAAGYPKYPGRRVPENCRCYARSRVRPLRVGAGQSVEFSLHRLQFLGAGFPHRG